MKYRQIILYIFVACCATSAVAQTNVQPFDYMDVFDLQFVSDPRISPDGTTIVYQRVQYDVMTDRRFSNLWQIDFNGDGHRPLTSGTGGYGNVTWSPTGERIAYTSAEEGSSQIFIRWMESGIASSITNITSSPGNLAWSPDGSSLLYTSFVPSKSETYGSIPSPPEGAVWESSARVVDDPVYRRDGGGYVQDGRTHIFLLSALGGAPRQLTSGDYNHTSPSWSPDSKSIVFTADRTGMADVDPNNAQIYLLDVETNELTQLTDKRGPHNGPSVSPDGKLIAYTGFEDKFAGYQQSEIYVMNRDGSNTRVISAAVDQSVSSLTWASDSKSLFFRYDENGNPGVGNIGLRGQVAPVADRLASASIGRPYSGGGYSVASNGRYAVAQGTATSPAELVVGHFPIRMAEQKLTNLNEHLLRSVKFGAVEEFWVDSSVDDFRIQYWVVTPPDFDASQAYPLILEIHGGPYTNYGPNFSPEIQLMASMGYVVVYANPRGSTSYGAEFAEYINFNYPSEDHDDLMDVVDAVVAKGYIDEDNLFITGGSGGGVLTAWAIGKTDRFAAAVVAKPVINWYSFVLTADATTFFSKYWFTKKPWEDPEQYLERSPISLVGNVNTPTMLITGQYDYRTPLSETEQYYTALQLQGVDAVMVHITGSGHGIASKPSNLFRKVAYITGWFERHKSGDE
ncbi:MAG: S9 family peptidase [Rhodothermales bacterium]|nr:S9 family peptidase [Rhodothermales bacterium]